MKQYQCGNDECEEDLLRRSETEAPERPDPTGRVCPSCSQRVGECIEGWGRF
jgi:hypothetical protein